MKLFLTISLPVLTNLSFGQSHYGFTTGIDTTALKFELKSKVEYRVSFDSLGNYKDSTFIGKTNYDSLGYVISYENLPSTHKIIFTYKNGYLINEQYDYIRGPIAIGSYGLDTTREKETIVWEQFENTKRKLEETIIYDYNSKESYTLKYVYHYHKQGKLITVDMFYKEVKSTSVYNYNQNGLLIEIVDTGFNYITKTVFEYTFY